MTRHHEPEMKLDLKCASTWTDRKQSYNKEKDVCNLKAISTLIVSFINASMVKDQ